MRLINADELIENIRKKLGIKNLDYLLPSEKCLIDEIEKAKPIEAIPISFVADWMGKHQGLEWGDWLSAVGQLVKDWMGETE